MELFNTYIDSGLQFIRKRAIQGMKMVKSLYKLPINFNDCHVIITEG